MIELTYALLLLIFYFKLGKKSFNSGKAIIIQTLKFFFFMSGKS